MGDPSVLVVEDEQNVRYIAAAALRLAGFAVSELATGRDALGHLADAGAACDLVVLDVMLPDVDGFEVCRRLRAAGNEVPIVFLTARDAVEDLWGAETMNPHAATSSYSWMRPPSTSRRRTSPGLTCGDGRSPASGTANAKPRCGRCWL
jgi:CheY-like chemotaxis protein